MAKNRAGVLWSLEERFHPGVSPPESLQGSSFQRSYPRYCPRHIVPVGFHRFEPVRGTGSLPPWAISYPTRNFAQCCYSPRSKRERRGAGHFCLPLHVAMQLGLSLHPLVVDARRIVSEDSRKRVFLIFPADCLHRSDCHCSPRRTSTVGYSGVPAYGRVQFVSYPTNGQLEYTTLGPS